MARERHNFTQEHGGHSAAKKAARTRGHKLYRVTMNTKDGRGRTFFYVGNRVPKVLRTRAKLEPLAV